VECLGQAGVGVAVVEVVEVVEEKIMAKQEQE
jgi:hypothetical protein